MIKTYSGRPHYARCSKCKKCRSLKNGSQVVGGVGAITWFARIDVLNRPNVKLSTDRVILMTYFWAHEIKLNTCLVMLSGLVSQRGSLIDWFNYIREMLYDSMCNALPMGGVEEIVQIDESYFRG